MQNNTDYPSAKRIATFMATEREAGTKESLLVKVGPRGATLFISLFFFLQKGQVKGRLTLNITNPSGERGGDGGIDGVRVSNQTERSVALIATQRH